MNRSILFGAVFLLAGLMGATGANAHSIYVFAYPEVTQICTNSYFGGKAKVRGGEVRMLAATGEVLGTATTDENGDACFARPATAQELLFRVTASGGHQGEFTLPTSGLGGAAAPNAVSGLTNDDLNKALAPFMRKMAEMESAQKSRVRLRDVIGGLGWLIGLAEAARWLKSRWKEG